MIFPESDWVYIKFGLLTPPGSDIKIINLNNPDYQMLAQGTYKVSVVVLNVNRKVRFSTFGYIDINFKINSYGTITYLKSKALDSISGGDINVTY